MFLGYKLLSFAQEKLLFNNLQYNFKITLTPCYWNEIIVLWSVDIEPEIKHMISQQLWNWNFHLCLITSGTVLFKHPTYISLAIIVDVYSLTMEGIFLKPPPPLISSRFLSTRGWAGAIGKVVARKFVTHPFLPCTPLQGRLKNWWPTPFLLRTTPPPPPPPLYLLTSPLIAIQSFLIIITDTSLNILKFNKLLVEGSLKSRQQQSKYLKQYQTCLLG